MEHDFIKGAKTPQAFKNTITEIFQPAIRLMSYLIVSPPHLALVM